MIRSQGNRMFMETFGPLWAHNRVLTVMLILFAVLSPVFILIDGPIGMLFLTATFGLMYFWAFEVMFPEDMGDGSLVPWGDIVQLRMLVCSVELPTLVPPGMRRTAYITTFFRRLMAPPRRRVT